MYIFVRFPLSNTFFIPDEIIVLIQVLCLLILGVSLILDAGHEIFSLEPDTLTKSENNLSTYDSKTMFGESMKIHAHQSPNKNIKRKWKLTTNPKGSLNRTIFTILLFIYFLKVLEVIFMFFTLTLSVEEYRAIRSFNLSTFSPIEGLIVVLIEKKYRNLLLVILRTIPRFLTLITFVGFGLLLYAILGKHQKSSFYFLLLQIITNNYYYYYYCCFLALRIFEPNSPEAEKYFPTLQEGIWSLVTILNAADWPDPIIPAYEDSQLYFIFFFSFLVIGSWGLLNASSGLVFTFFRLFILFFKF